MSAEATSEEVHVEEEVEEIDDDEEEEEEEDEDDEEEDLEEEEEEEEGEVEEVTHGRRSGRGLTLKTLLKEGILEPGQGHMSINYLGNKFKGDLLPDGRIRSQETNKIFGTPSAWAIFCKKIVNPDKKSGCGWASVRYRGKKLDAYKNNWYRQKRLEFEREGEELDEEESGSESEGPHEQEVVEFEVIGGRSPSHDMGTMVELTTFQSLGRLQPFSVTMSSSAMAVIDVHGHLTTSEVVGYLAGQWDVNNHNLIVSHAFPVLCRLGDAEKGPTIEQTLYAEMSKMNLSLVGWYHTHPSLPPLPTLRDVDSQLDYEMKMKGYSDSSYTPCIGIITCCRNLANVAWSSIFLAPCYQGPLTHGSINCYWVMPPPEHKPHEYGRPMSIHFSVVQDAFIPKEALLYMKKCIRFYRNTAEVMSFMENFQDGITYWDKLKTAVCSHVPKDHAGALLEFLAKVMDLKLPPGQEKAVLSIPPPPLIPVTSTAGGESVSNQADIMPVDDSSAACTPVSSSSNLSGIPINSSVSEIRSTSASPAVSDTKGDVAESSTRSDEFTTPEKSLPSTVDCLSMRKSSENTNDDTQPMEVTETSRVTVKKLNELMAPEPLYSSDEQATALRLHGLHYSSSSDQEKRQHSGLKEQKQNLPEMWLQSLQQDPQVYPLHTSILPVQDIRKPSRSVLPVQEPQLIPSVSLFLQEKLSEVRSHTSSHEALKIVDLESIASKDSQQSQKLLSQQESSNPSPASFEVRKEAELRGDSGDEKSYTPKPTEHSHLHEVIGQFAMEDIAQDLSQTLLPPPPLYHIPSTAATPPVPTLDPNEERSMEVDD